MKWVVLLYAKPLKLAVLTGPINIRETQESLFGRADQILISNREWQYTKADMLCVLRVAYKAKQNHRDRMGSSLQRRELGLLSESSSLGTEVNNDRQYNRAIHFTYFGEASQQGRRNIRMVWLPIKGSSFLIPPKQTFFSSPLILPLGRLTA